LIWENGNKVKGRNMKKTITLLSLLVIVMGASSAFAAETSVKGTVYSTWMLNQTDGADNYNAFTIDRAYFGAESKLSDYTNLRITFDIRPERFSTSETKVVDSGGDTVKIPTLSAYSGYPIILKYAYADWKIKPVAEYFNIRFGLQPTMYANYMEGIWNRRYIEKNLGDLNGWLSTSDLGLSFNFTLGSKGNLGEAGFSVLNGTKYSDFVDKNKNKDINLYGKLLPFYNSGDFNQVALFGQFYTGTQNKTFDTTIKAADWGKQIVSIGGKLAYQKAVDFCLDMNFQTLGQGAGNEDLKQSGLSFWGDLYLNALVPSQSLFKKLALFVRADIYDPNTKVDKDGNTLIIAGVECAPIKGVKASLDIRNKSYQAEGTKDEKYLFLNTEFKF
jgi:hypothetical protein